MANPAGRSIDRDAYPFRSRWLDLSAGRMHYVDEGQGEPLLFVHGTPTWSFEWRHLIRALSPRLRCVALTDAVGDRRTQNQPGTVDEYPNWRVPLSGPDQRPLPLEDVFGSARARAVAAAVAADVREGR